QHDDRRPCLVVQQHPCRVPQILQHSSPRSGTVTTRDAWTSFACFRLASHGQAAVLMTPPGVEWLGDPWLPETRMARVTITRAKRVLSLRLRSIDFWRAV